MYANIAASLLNQMYHLAEKKKSQVRSEVLKATNVKMAGFRDAAPCSLLDTDRITPCNISEARM
jgi:hypothetical protein